MKLFRWRKSKFARVLEKLESLTEQVEEFSDLLADLDNKDSKTIVSLKEENNLLRDRLHQKDIYIENLLAQLLGGVSVKSLANSEPKKEESSVSPAMKRYMEKKKANGGVPLP